ncbi:TetR/AcrR family transcriptional regulator [Frigidibacter sp. RF13]|uniref:TetR/AcrR family transcriptional regulator n=1 Tax=Frigidibacter sp. RF13 TaxID=2997340 RepID=UPI00226F12CB|nr:TetR/AcrR family transcriptional regulator [Frigidibacter sp. RF13]MCY1127794.1 TetR/AcrR family transcriptional regulator [Frigidibacter sp. RF13]
MTTEPGKRQPYRRNEDRRHEIAEAAIACLVRDGHAKLTARAVAKEAGLSLGHITYHFRDMDEILCEAYRIASSRLRQATAEDLGARTSGDPLERLETFVRAGFKPDFLSRGYLRLRLDLWSAAVDHPTLAETEAALYESYREELATLLGDIAHDRNAQAVRICATTDTIMALLDGLWLDWIRRGNENALENGLSTAMELARSLAKP